MGLATATSLNMLDMIGVGPFITMPLIVSAMGGPQAMLGWILGAGFAICDGLVWAELGAAMPGSGGSYRYLKEIYGPNSLGRLISFLFIWQLSFSAPLSIASGCIGLAGYAAYFWPGLEHQFTSRMRRSAQHSAGRKSAGELGGHLGNAGRCWRVSPGGVSALPADHGDRETLEAVVGRRDGHDWVDHFRRPDALQQALWRSTFRRARSPFRAAFSTGSAARC